MLAQTMHGERQWWGQQHSSVLITLCPDSSVWSDKKQGWGNSGESIGRVAAGTMVFLSAAGDACLASVHSWEC